MDIPKAPIFTIFNSECQKYCTCCWNANTRNEKMTFVKHYSAKTEHFLTPPPIISFRKLVNVVAKGKQLRTQTSQNRFFQSNDSKPEFNKLMKSVSISGFILHIDEK